MTEFEEKIEAGGGTEDLDEILADFACTTRTKLGMSMEAFSEKIGVPHREYFLVLLEVINKRAETYHAELILESCQPTEASH